jgi:hypothetical protein
MMARIMHLFMDSDVTSEFEWRWSGYPRPLAAGHTATGRQAISEQNLNDQD